jgi:hypothetical protein
MRFQRSLFELLKENFPLFLIESSPGIIYRDDNIDDLSVTPFCAESVVSILVAFWEIFESSSRLRRFEKRCADYDRNMLSRCGSCELDGICY